MVFSGKTGGVTTLNTLEKNGKRKEEEKEDEKEDY